MANSKRQSSVRKPSAYVRSERKAAMGLPPEFPLFPHKSGRWAKQVRSKRHYFGKVADDPKGDAALRLWLEQKDELLAGRTPREKTDGLTMRELCDRFIQSRDEKLDNGEITAVTRRDYKNTTDRLVDHFGKNRLVTDLVSEDFAALRASIAKTRGPVALGNEMGRVRVVFKFAKDNRLVPEDVIYGSEFKRPSRKVLRLERAKKGKRMIEATDVRRLIEEAGPQLKAMILLAINCGFGNTDCGTLPLDSLDLKEGWLNYHRQKTGIDRRCPLWPETVAALRTVVESRRNPTDGAADGCVFVTKYGGSWAGVPDHNPVTKEFRKLLDDLELYKPGIGFYALRHVFRTVGGGAKDLEAIRSLMGHTNEHVEDSYIEGIEDERLLAVTNHVRAWLFPKESKEADADAEREPTKRQPKAKRPSGKSTPRAGREQVAEARPLRIVG